jgi:hypothetical protein
VKRRDREDRSGTLAYGLVAYLDRW